MKKKAPKEQASNEQALNEQALNEQVMEDQATEKQATDEQNGEAVDIAALGEERPIASEAEDAQIRAILEAIIYVTDEPLSAQQIAAALERPIDVVSRLLEELVTEYAKPEHGLSIREVAGGFKMATKAEHHEAVRAFVKKLTPPLKLSLAALETLAVIAYKQPVTAPEIMEIRGVQGAGVLKTLIDRKLVTEAGRKKVVGQPILYKTTKEFLVQFGLKDLKELPTLKEFEELGRMAVAEQEELPLTGAPAADSAAEAVADEAETATAELAEETAEGEPSEAVIADETATEEESSADNA
jgi:segregation and condensation protein B